MKIPSNIPKEFHTAYQDGYEDGRRGMTVEPNKRAAIRRQLEAEEKKWVDARSTEVKREQARIMCNRLQKKLDAYDLGFETGKRTPLKGGV